MAQYKTINKDNLAKMLDSMASSGKTVIAPRNKAGNVVFAYVDKSEQINYNYIQTTLSAKSAIFPRCEELFSYEKNDGGNPVIKQPVFAEKEVILFGLHPCDAYGFDYMYDFFEKENPDYHIASRKERTTIISLSCKSGDEYCFCTSVGLSPSGTEGSDILLTETNNDGYYAEFLTEKGLRVLAEYGTLFSDSKEIDKSQYTAKLETKFNLKEVQSKLDKVFDSDLWKEQSLACLGCGACAYVCPTCSCFDIQEDSNPYGGSRLRCWDSCGIGLFTLHASGHNPRSIQSQRWRQRIMHKLDYSVKNLGVVSCVGCGRCERACPAEMNIIEHLIGIQEAS